MVTVSTSLSATVLQGEGVNVTADAFAAAVEQAINDLLPAQSQATLAVTLSESAFTVVVLAAGCNATTLAADVEARMCMGTMSCVASSTVESSRRRRLDSTLTTSVSRTYNAGSTSVPVSEAVALAVTASGDDASVAVTQLTSLSATTSVVFGAATSDPGAESEQLTAGNIVNGVAAQLSLSNDTIEVGVAAPSAAPSASPTHLGGTPGNPTPAPTVTLNLSPTISPSDAPASPPPSKSNEGESPYGPLGA